MSAIEQSGDTRTEKTSIQINSVLIKKVRMACVEYDTTQTAAIEQGLRLWLQNPTGDHAPVTVRTAEPGAIDTGFTATVEAILNHEATREITSVLRTASNTLSNLEALLYRFISHGKTNPLSGAIEPIPDLPDHTSGPGGVSGQSAKSEKTDRTDPGGNRSGKRRAG